MIKIKALVVKDFVDKKSEKLIKKGTIIDVTIDRFNEITNKLGALNLVKGSRAK